MSKQIDKEELLKFLEKYKNFHFDKNIFKKTTKLNEGAYLATAVIEKKIKQGEFDAKAD